MILLICIGYSCDNCTHQHEDLIDGWKTACDAFPDGIPSRFACLVEPKPKICNNGIGYEPIDRTLETT